MNREYIKRVNQAVDYISRSFDRELTLEDIAEKAHFSKFHFHRIFKAVTGETVSAHIRRIRLENAANKILSNSGETITAIAMDCGFNSSQNFATAFKKQYKVSPRDFRSAHDDASQPPEKAGSKYSTADIYSRDRIPGPAGTGLVCTGPDSESVNLWINVMQMPSYHVAYERVVGPYGMERYDKAMTRLMEWGYGKCNIEESIFLGIVWDNPEVTDPEKCRYDICMTVPEDIEPSGSIGVRNISEGTYAVGHCEVSGYDPLEKAYETIFSGWFPASEYLPADSFSYEIYLNNPANHPRGSLLMDICIPVVPV